MNRRPFRKCAACSGRGYNLGWAGDAEDAVGIRMSGRTILLPCGACGGEGYKLFRGYRWEPCTGEAHGNAHIDNCTECAPRWGMVAVKVGGAS